MRRHPTTPARRTPRLAAALAAALLLLGAAPALHGPGSRAAGQEQDAGPAAHPELIILVRHGETAPDGTRDPGLSETGVSRADRLAALLADAGLTRIHTTGYRRTRGTAAPVAAALGMGAVEYDPRDLPAFAALLVTEPGRHLVVGHSNTTPELVALLGGDPGPPIAEDEHGRVYVLVPTGDGVRSLVLRY